ncbi:MAG: hypothetical protein RR316_05205 [Clostridia bacterium]
MNEFKNRISAHFLYNWIVYIAAAIVVVLLWTFLFGVIWQKKDNEKLAVFISAPNNDMVKVYNYVFDKLQTKGIKELTFDGYSPKNSYYDEVFATRGIIDTDVLILPQDRADEAYKGKLCVKLPKDILNMILPKDKVFEFYEKDGCIYGIKIYSTTNEKCRYFEDVITYNLKDEKAIDYYLFFNPSSVNIGSLSANKNANHNDTQAFDLVMLMLQYATNAD